MPLSVGVRLGPYEIQSLIGAGGMGEVYKARDTRLDRTVAIKILPASLAADPQFRERFEREARAISQLDHPNICALYDVGEHAGTAFLVMHYLEGDTLAARLTKGPLPLVEAVTIGMQIAGALDKAHRAGIVHRDLKPGNVMLTRAGARLLDFGLAKTGIAAITGLSMLPTTPPNITAQGTILGTFQYMAPEQVEGHEADARTDIFALGALLFEMVTGRPAFHGKTHASLIGAILRDDPTTSVELSAAIPPALARAIKTCLAKDPDDRFQTAHDVTLQLQWILEGGSQVVTPAVVAAPRRGRERTAWMLAAAAAIVAAALAIAVFVKPVTPSRVVRFEVGAPEGVIAIDAPRLSPDGRLLAFNATDSEGRTRIWVRPLNTLTAHALAGTEGAARPFWSPDSRFIGFMAEGKLKKIEVSGGPAQKVADAPTGADGSWSSEGVILFDGRGTDPIYKVAAAGGAPTVAVKPEPSRKETLTGWPEFLPDGRHFLYLAMNERPEDSVYRIGSLESTETQALAPAQTQLAYAPPGFLLFVRDKTLVAQAFDAKALKITAEPVPLAERIGTDSIGLARFSVSADGTLAYRTGDPGRRFVWVDRSGRELEQVGEPGEYGEPAISPDATRMAFGLSDPRTGKYDVWIRDLARAVSSRFTFGPGANRYPVWSPDGKTVVFSSDRAGQAGLYEKPGSGQGEEKLLFKSDAVVVATDWSRDGRYLVVQIRGSGTDNDVWALPTFGDRKPMQVVGGPLLQGQAVFSPDGRYIAYQSAESGRGEIYVQPFPGATGKWQVSNAGGADPRWRADGREIVYRAPDQKLMAVDVVAREGFEAGIPRPLFLEQVVPGPSRNKHLMSGDGKRFLIVAPLGRDALTPTTIVMNWHAELAR